MHARALLLLPVLFGSVACASGPKLRTGVLETSLEDGRITAGVRTALVNDAALGLRDIAVEARNGVVSLSGEVYTDDEAQKAVTLAQGVRGVREVKSSLKPATSATAANPSAALRLWQASPR